MKNVLTLFVGNTLAQAIPVGIAPILTRLYTPDELGTFALFVTIATLFGGMATARYELAIGLPKNDEESDDIVRLCYVLTFLISSLLMVAVVLFNDNIINIIGNPDLQPWLYFMPVSVFLTGISQTLIYKFNRHRKFKLISIAKMTQASGTSSIQLFSGFTYLKHIGLISGQLAGQLITVVFFYIKFGTRLTLNKKILLDTISRYKNFFFLNAPTSLMDKFAASMPILFISKFFKKEVAGHFALAERTIGAPLSLVSSAIGQVLLEKITSLEHANLPIRKFVLKTLLGLTALSFAPALILYTYGETLFTIFFGQSWKEAGQYSSILSFAYFIRFIVSPLSMVLISLHKLKPLVIWQTLYFLSTCAIMISVILFGNNNLLLFLKAYAFNEIVMYAIYLIFILYSIKK